MPENELWLQNQIKTSVDYAFRPGSNAAPEIAAARNKLAAESEGLKENLLGLVGDFAKEAAKEGIFTGIASGIQRRIRSSVWENAAARSRQTLEKETKQGKLDWVIATLNAIDPPDIPLQILNPKPGKPIEIKVRQSVNLPRGSQVRLVEIRATSFFPDNQINPNQIVVGGQAFDKTTIIATLDGSSQHQPMWMKDGALLPLIDESGQIYMIKISHAKLSELRERLGGIEQKPAVLQTKTIEAPRLIKGFEPNPETTAVYSNCVELKYGAAELASPHHQIEDAHGTAAVLNNQTEIVAIRFISVDGSGGSLPEQNRHLIGQKVASIKTDLITSSQLNAKAAIEAAHKKALAASAQNPAYAGVVVVDVYPDKINIARKGDHSVVLWRPEGYAHRRGEAWGENRGGPSNFQSIDVPQNLAYSLKATENPLDPKRTLTRALEDTGESNLIWSAVGMENGGGISAVTINRDDVGFEYLLILSDGARGSGTLLDPADDYSRSVNQIMIQLFSGQITEVETARQICQLARQIPGETDDITVQIVKIPMPSPA